MPRKVTAALAPISGLLYGLSFQPYHFPYLAWIALVPLFVAVSDPDATRLTIFRRGLFTGLVANLIIFAWLWPTFEAARINLPTTFLCWFLLALILALYFGGFAVFYRALPGPAARVWIGAAAWVTLDEVRSVILTGFPWALLSHTQSENVPLIQLASITGAAGVSFVVLSINAALAETALDRRTRGTAGLRQLAIAVGLVLVVLGWGTWRLGRADKLETRPFKVAILQGNIDQYQKWDDKYEADIRDSYGRLAVQAAAVKPDLILWPESSVPAWIPKDEPYVKWLVWIASATAVPHLFGSLSTNGRHEMNSAFVMWPDGRLEGQYNKRHLVPFGEYIPFGGFLKHVVPYLGQVGIFDAGTDEKIFEVKGVKLSPNICYEAMFPALVRDSARAADVIVNLTNDGWFLQTGGPHQHFSVNLFRAVENGRPVVRAANTGISAVIDAFGRVRMQSPLMAWGMFSDVVPVPPHEFRTFYGRFGNWFGYGCFFVCAAVLARRWRR